MIQMKFPHMVLNAEDYHGPHYKMWNTYTVPVSHDAPGILAWTAVVADGAPGGKLGSLVIHCHGYEVNSHGGYGLQLGTGVQRRHTPLFSCLKGLVGEIYIVACKAAEITDPGTRGDGDGNLFCCEERRHECLCLYRDADPRTLERPVGYPLWPNRRLRRRRLPLACGRLLSAGEAVAPQHTG